METVQEKLEKLGCEVTPCGSRVTCNPPPVDTDQDFLVFCHNDAQTSNAVSLLDREGYVWEGAPEHYQNVAGSGFLSWRKDSVNLIVSSSEEFVKRHKVATFLCARLNLMKKSDRIAVFQAVLYNKEDARP